MARDNHPRSRQARALARKVATKPPYDRVLIVCEGSKTEPNYFDEIRQKFRLPSAHIVILHSANGTEPRQVVDSAEEAFLKSKGFEAVYAVFDRDDHRTYLDALTRAEALDGKHRNDEKKPMKFCAVPSVPCFELWLLLHYEYVQAFAHRRELIERLRHFIPDYEKGASGVFALTESGLGKAKTHALRLRGRFDPRTGTDPITSVDEVVEKLCSLVSQ